MIMTLSELDLIAHMRYETRQLVGGGYSDDLIERMAEPFITWARRYAKEQVAAELRALDAQWVTDVDL